MTTPQKTPQQSLVQKKAEQIFLLTLRMDNIHMVIAMLQELEFPREDIQKLEAEFERLSVKANKEIINLQTLINSN